MLTFEYQAVSLYWPVSFHALYSFIMWKPVTERDKLHPGDKLKLATSFIGSGLPPICTEYEVVEKDKKNVVLKPLRTNGYTHTDNPAKYKKMERQVLYALGLDIWMP